MKNIIVVDLDGTVSILGGRINHILSEPKDWNKFYDECDKDLPNIIIIDMIKSLVKSNDYFIVFCSGRIESVREKTENWIQQNFGEDFFYLDLLLRPDEDDSEDRLIKPQMLFEKYSKDNIAFVLEDRQSVVERWRDFGLVCLQVAKGNF